MRPDGRYRPSNSSLTKSCRRRGAEALDCGDPAELGDDYARLLRQLPHLRVLGGCCGTDQRHVAAIARAVRPRPAATAA